MLKRILVGITNFGTYHDDYLRRLLSEYLSMGLSLKVLVFSDRWKNLDGFGTVVVKEVAQDTLSLTWAHRERFAQHAEEFDYFLYSEDDILITKQNVEAWIAANDALGDCGKVPGFFVKEVGLGSRVNYPQGHSPFHWNGFTERIDGRVFAKHTNVHSACTMLSRKQLRIAIDSGKYVAPAHGEGRYAVRELACSGPFVECGLEKVIEVTHFDDFCVQHLPASYIGVLGTAEEVMRKQVENLGGRMQ